MEETRGESAMSQNGGECKTGGKCMNMHQFCHHRCCVVRCIVTIFILALVFMAGVCVGAQGEYRHGERWERSFGSQYDSSFEAHFERMHGGGYPYNEYYPMMGDIQVTSGTPSVRVAPMMGVDATVVSQ